MKTAKRILEHSAFVLSTIFAVWFGIWLKDMPNTFDWLHQCPAGINVCTVTVNVTVIFAAWIILALAIGNIADLIKKGWIICKTSYGRLIEWLHFQIKAPKINPKFDLPEKNDLRLHIKTKWENVNAKFMVKDFLCTDGRKYIWNHPDELKAIGYSHGSNMPFFSGQLTPNEDQEVIMSYPHNGKVALRQDDWHVYNFQDGTYEYVIGYSARYQNEKFDYPDFSVWLIIENGELVGIEDKQ